MMIREPTELIFSVLYLQFSMYSCNIIYSSTHASIYTLLTYMHVDEQSLGFITQIAVEKYVVDP